MHLVINTQRKNYNLIFQTNWKINSTSYDSLWSVNGSESEIVELADYPFSSYWTRRFLGSCNGLVCIWFGSTRAERSICFCNPTTREYKIMNSESVPWHNSICNSAFGYDCNANDYKLIILDESSGSTKLLVYMLRSDTWKSSQPVRYTFHNKMQTGTCLNGAFHWLGQANSSKLITVFDFSNEKFNELQLPNELLEKKKHLSMTIGVLDGYLCVVVPSPGEVCFQVWAMQDYAVQESWTLRYTFDCGELIFADFNALKIMSCFRNGHILVRYGFMLFIYDPNHPEGRKPKSLSSSPLRDSADYVESLVPLYSGTYAGRMK